MIKVISEQIADTSSTIPFDTCLYIYFIFRRTLNGNIVKRNTLQSSSNVIDTISGHAAQVQPSRSNSLLLRERGTVIPRLLIRRSFLSNQAVRQRDTRTLILRGTWPLSESYLQTCALTSTSVPTRSTYGTSVSRTFRYDHRQNP